MFCKKEVLVFYVINLSGIGIQGFVDVLHQLSTKKGVLGSLELGLDRMLS